ncbi:hypothetical protein ACWIGI_33625 [Nocardia sp. NPDC055321]
MRLAGMTAAAAGALFLPALLAPSAGAEVEDITVMVLGGDVPSACDTVGQSCRVMARMFGEDYALPATVTINGKPLASAERLDYPHLERSAIVGEWRPTAKGKYTIVATQGSSTKSLVVEITGIDTGSLSGVLPSGSAG